MSNESSDLECLEVYLMEEYDIDIVWGKDEVDAYYYDNDIISINTNHSKEIQIFCLLHEAGHLILRKRQDFQQLYPHVGKRGSTQLSKIDMICEEINAWKEGRALALMLGININDARWENYWKHQVYKYVRWAADKEK
jgi:hypothetical protein